MYRIVIADDDEILLRGLCENIPWENYGVEVVASVENGWEALDAVKRLHPDILLTDVRMPLMDGIALISQVKKLNADIATVIISAHDEFSYVHKALKQGAEDYILKPVNLENLEAVVKKIVAEKNMKQEVSSKIDKSVRTSMYEALLTSSLSAEEFQLNFSGLIPALENEAYCLLFIKTDPIKLHLLHIPWEEENSDVLPLLGRCLLILWDRNTHLLKGRLHDLKLQIRKRLSFPEDEDLIFINGSIVPSFMELSESYNEALQVEDLLFIHRGGGDLSLKDFEKARHKGPHSDAVASEIARITLMGNKEALPDELERYTDSIRNSGTMAKLAHTFSLSILFAALESGFEKAGLNLGDVVGKSTDSLQSILQEKSLESGMHVLLEKLNTLCHHILIKNDSSSAGVMMKALKYMELHFNDPHLRIHDVAEYAGLSKNYFSIVFKDSSGKSFTEYLTGLRMEKAKSLLGNTNYRSYEISYMVGYSNPTYFSSTFKKVYGMTPTEYANTYK